MILAPDSMLKFVLVAGTVILNSSVAVMAAGWVQWPPQGWEKRTNAKMLAESKVREIKPSRMGEGLNLLQRVSSAEITPSEVTRLTGQRCKKKLFQKFVIVRALCGHELTGNYSVFVSKDGGELLVTHGSLGSHQTPTPSVLIVELRKVPFRTFASCDFAL